MHEFTFFYRELDLFGGELIVTDGHKFGEANRHHRNITERRLKNSIQRIEEKKTNK